jgi:putative ABC transport system ATP-binding protein
MAVLTGRSGGGKSTLLNMLGGLLAPSSGKVLFDETDIYQMDDAALSRFRNQKIGIIPQVQTGIGSLNVTENILLPYTLYKEKPEDMQYLQQLMERLDIANLAQAMPAELSGGEMRRMSIARALIRKPGVILADEPTGDLDDENTAAVLALLRETAHAGAAVLLVTHENAAADYADRMLRMDGGVLTEV